MNHKLFIAAIVTILLLLGGCGVSNTTKDNIDQQISSEQPVRNEVEHTDKEETNSEDHTDVQLEQDPDESIDKQADGEQPEDVEMEDRRLIKASITKIVDGDTIDLKLIDSASTKEQVERVRLLLVDTPEVHGAKEGQKFGAEASALAKEFLPIGKEVILEMDVADRDKYGRLLGHIWIGRVSNDDAFIQSVFAVQI